MQEELNWLTLQLRRQKSLVLIYKNMLQYKYGCPPGSILHTYFISTHGSTRHHNFQSFIYLSAQTNCRK